MTWHGYFAAEDLNLTGLQRSTIVSELRALGTRNNSLLPHERNHWRVRDDGNAAIYEAVFEDSVLSIPNWKSRLSVLFGVDSALIGHAVSSPTFDTTASAVVTFSYLTVDYFRVALFGGVSATLEQSRVEAKAYLSTNAEDWTGE